MIPPDRHILHVDLDAFFASVEQLDDLTLRGRPVLVGHDGPRGVVSAASYEARVFGCRSAQPVAVAKRLCPQAAIVPGRYWRYRELSQQVFSVFHDMTPLVEPLSIDEAFLDVTGSIRALGSPEEIAKRIRARVKAETGLTASVGVAPNKFLAKLASDINKPDGLTIVRPGNVAALLIPMKVERIFGIGPKTAERLASVGIRTIGDLRNASPEYLQRRLGSDADHYRRLAFGQDDRPVVPDHEAKSIGQEETFGVDLPDPEQVRDVLLGQAEQVGQRLRKHGLRARAVTVKIRFGDFKTITRRCTLEAHTDVTSHLWEAARSQFDRWAAQHFSPVRLIGMSASDFVNGEGQLDLFADPEIERQKRLDAAMDRINQRFGKGVIRRGKPGS